MTEDLLLLSGADAKREVLKENINLSVLITEIYDSFRPLFAENDLIAGGTDIAQDDIYIYANGHSIRQLVTIFLDNAVKYTKSGGSISVRLEKLEKYAYIKVIDTGIGMPPETKDKIFERFFRIDKARSKATGGAGLGLSIAKTIADGHGGDITVESEQDRGSEFCVRLPL
jgi:signal transduction histidine kinase